MMTIGTMRLPIGCDNVSCSNASIQNLPAPGYGRLTCRRMNRLEADETGVLSWTCNRVVVFTSTVVPLVVQEDAVRSSVTSTEKVTSVALGFLGEVRRVLGRSLVI